MIERLKTQPRAQKTIALMVSLAASMCCTSALQAGSLDSASRDLASKLRAQPYDTEEPGWLVERADNSSMRLSAMNQTRYMVSARQAGFIAPGSEKTYGFSMPRTRIALDGTIVSSQFSYRISFDFGDAELSRGRGTGGLLAGDTGSARLLDAYGQYNFAGKREGYYLKFGQFQHVLLTEESTASEFQLAIDRSMTSELFGPGYTQGIALGHVGDSFAWEASINDGGRLIGSRETDNTSFDSTDEADVGFAFRADWKTKGSWDQFEDFTSFVGHTSGTKFGAGLLYQFVGNSNPGSGGNGFIGAAIESAQIFTWTADFQHEGDGWNFFAAYVGHYVDWEFPNATASIMNNAFVIQSGWFLSDQTEMYLRFETFWLDKLFRNGFGTPDGYIHRIGTIGVNHYVLPESHAVKLSADVSYSFDSLFALSVGNTDNIGLPDPAVTGFQGLTEHEAVFRMQLQFLF